MSEFWQFFRLSAPLFVIVFAGYVIAKWRWRREWTELGSKLVFMVALPALLFHMMTGLSQLPPVDARLLIAFFGGCLLVFFIGRFVSARVFKLDGVAQSVFALAGVFSNNVLLGVPIAKLTLGEQAMPSVALVLVFNALTLWTLVTISVEWARHGSFTMSGFGKTTLSVLKNPLVASIVAGTLVGWSGIKLPGFIDVTLAGIGKLSAPLALLVLGMGLAEYGIRQGLNQSLTICVIKLLVQPLVVWGLAVLLNLPPLETSVVVLLSSLAIGVNVYMMAMQFGTLQSTIASSLVLSTGLASLTTPVLLSLLHALRPDL
ncbi:AEC family transporter [Steroidobacter sp.]|uniref:AEC family transporter n=1 Tax=Steroidobacter sp. TaxID=1978227 RepID=UPI001A52047A|nr:AEC family transporter [Steroidobacter sp.]MBL8269126.1 AEC family transporter [Steroidobacter sp.]